MWARTHHQVTVHKDAGGNRSSKIESPFSLFLSFFLGVASFTFPLNQGQILHGQFGQVSCCAPAFSSVFPGLLEILFSLSEQPLVLPSSGSLEKVFLRPSPAPLFLCCPPSSSMRSFFHWQSRPSVRSLSPFSSK